MMPLPYPHLHSWFPPVTSPLLTIVVGMVIVGLVGVVLGDRIHHREKRDFARDLFMEP